MARLGQRQQVGGEARRVDEVGVRPVVVAADRISVAPQLVEGRDGDAAPLGRLDAATGARPVVLASADLHSVWLNSAALHRFGYDPADVDSPLTEDEAFAVLRALDTVPVETSDAWVDEALRRAAARGITRIVDFEMAWNLESWTRRVATRPLAARVDFGIYPQDLARALDEGLTTGREIAGLLRVGSLKIISDGSLTTRTARWTAPIAPAAPSWWRICSPTPAGWPTASRCSGCRCPKPWA